MIKKILKWFDDTEEEEMINNIMIRVGGPWSAIAKLPNNRVWVLECGIAIVSLIIWGIFLYM